MPPVTALVPLRAPGTGKTRLADGLSAEERAAVTAAMLADVVAAISDAPVDRIVVAAASDAAATAAAVHGVDVVVDRRPGEGLDAAVDDVARSVEGTLLVVAADLPRLTSADIAAVLDPPVPVVVAPTTDGGTGGLVRRPPTVIPTAYGPGSARCHVELARDRGVEVATVDRVGFRYDVDVWDDLRALRVDEVGNATAAFVAALGGRLRGTG